MDESGVHQHIEYEYGWAKRGRRIYGEKPGSKGQRINIIGGLNNGKLIAPAVFEGYCNTEVFELYLEEHLLPNLKAGQVLILDNASFHKSEKAKSIAEASKCLLKYLPPYSPDFNPIEKKWADLKSNIKKFRRNHEINIHSAIAQAINSEMSGAG